ncbi:MAG: fumarylacetoacetate hydrolase family protein [Candidatus Marinimicrobia bacterium]|nr:fumarylacetoacetate hydrolase family protein [Candidatus Neomarinimicrobiota bacterium]
MTNVIDLVRCTAVITQFEPPDLKDWTKNFLLKLNGRVVQQANMNEMIFSIPELIEYFSARSLFIEDDIIFTGTPSTVDHLQNGNKLRVGLVGEMKTVLYI